MKGFRLALLWLSMVGCKPGPGSTCQSHEAHCLDAKRALVCDEGRLVETPCRGKAGCSTAQERVACDISANLPGDACSQAEQGVAVCLPDGAMLSCHGRKYERVACRGPRGCEMLGEQASCDQSVAEPREVCNKEGAKACSTDGSQVLVCTGGRLAPLYFCRGEAGCRAVAGKLSCDQTLARLGDACDKTLGGSTACAADKKSLLVCQAERFALSERCKAGKSCKVDGQSTQCERP